MLKLPSIDTLVKQAIKANVKQFRAAREEYYYWNAKCNASDRSSREYLKYTIFADQHFYEYVTIKDTLIRLFPEHKDLIVDSLYSRGK